MPTIKSIGELCYRQFFPNPGDESAIDREEFIETAVSIYARSVWLQEKIERRENGLWNVPSELLTEVELEVVDNQIDLTDLNILRSLSNDKWLQNIGGLTCECEYVGSNVNMTQLVCDDEFQEGKTYIIIGNKIKFPQGTHATPLSIIYANNGLGVDGIEDIEIDGSLAATVREQLMNLYAKKGQEDLTNNSNSNA